ncbi:GNAT family N-acetyltransferase [Chitinimonas arctica]|uniref:GNAT family N-acetyltransferase n=1 Tax=Chitinimonas arctica TaxID=2594795 RepID=A0A516SCT7_9NEIS|nr:GNAT family N-acetyltransferase [Chitinimonas arctica]QDQ25950.1 GNAT family N-acetyltransferase [Chitinimonas arctica]
MIEGTIRTLSRHDKAAFIEVMDNAFRPDPLFQKLFVAGQPQAVAAQRSRTFLGFMFDMACLLGQERRGLFVGDKLLGCYILEKSGGSLGRKLAGIGRLLRRVLLLPWRISWSVFAYLNRYMRATEQASPPQPHRYLRMIGVHESARGKGIGGQLLSEIVQRADADPCSEGLALDTENPVNLELYAKYDFRLSEEKRLDGLTIFCMVRRKRAAQAQANNMKTPPGGGAA